MLLERINVISHEGKFVASKMIKIVPCIDPSFMQVIKNYPHPIVSYRFDFHNSNMTTPKYYLFTSYRPHLAICSRTANSEKFSRQPKCATISEFHLHAFRSVEREFREARGSDGRVDGFSRSLQGYHTAFPRSRLSLSLKSSTLRRPCSAFGFYDVSVGAGKIPTWASLKLEKASKLQTTRRRNSVGGDGAAVDEGGPGGLDVDGEGLVGREGEAVEEEDAHLTDLVVRFPDEGVHVEDPVEGVDLGEGGDVDREAPVGEHDPEHPRRRRRRRRD